jgi:DNA-binding NarL/FixJ family response regulator
MAQPVDRERLDVMLRCLIVDDNDRFAAAARRVLVLEGVDVVGTASSVAEALHCERRLRPDLALIDLEIGRESGFDLARRLANLAVPERPQVIMMSARRPEDYEELVAGSSVVGFIAKQDLSAAGLESLIRAQPGGHR